MMIDCPDCPNEGWYVVGGYEPICCGHFNQEGGCCGNIIKGEIEQQEQCEFCHTNPDSVFNNREDNQ